MADHMQIGGPEFSEQLPLLIHVVAESGDIIGKGVDPNVHHVLRVKIHGNAPFEGGAGDAEILKSPFGPEKVVQHFLCPRLRFDEVGVAFDIFNKSGGVLACLKEIGLLFCHFYGSAAVGAFSVHKLGGCVEGFAGDAVPALVFVFVDIPLLIQPLENMLYGLFVLRVGGADEIVVGGIHFIPNAPDNARHAVHIFLRRYALFFRKLFDLQSMLIGAGAEKDVIALLPLVSGDGIGENDLIGIADVRLAGSIGNGCGNIIFSFLIFLVLFHSNSF